MKMTEPCNLGLLALISAAGEISYEELKQRYLPPEQPGVIQGVTASFDNDSAARCSLKLPGRAGSRLRRS